MWEQFLDFLHNWLLAIAGIEECPVCHWRGRRGQHEHNPFDVDPQQRQNEKRRTP